MGRYRYLITLLFIPEVAAVADLSDFFPYGDTYHDKRLHPNDDEYSPPQNISVEFTFFTESHSKLYVNTNGLVSFNYGISTYISEPFPQIGALTVLSPFWADIETTYCDPDCVIWYRESTHQRDLNKATNEIKKYFPVMKHFDATWTFIVTWYNVTRFNTRGSEEFNERNTFQAVLITDNESTFVIYYYNRIEWTGSTPAQVGFNMGDFIHFYSVEGSRTENIINLPNLTNVNDPGTFAFRVDLKDIHEAPPSGDPGKCYLKPSDLVFVVDLSLSTNKTRTMKLINELIDYLPINEYEFQIGMTTFSEKAQREFYFNDSTSQEAVKKYIDKLDVVSSTSDLTQALVLTRQMYMYNYRGSRSYAKKLALIFTDGLMPEGNLIAEANTLKSISTIAMVGIGTSVQHSLLDKLATNETVLSPNAERIWGYLQMRLARPSCLVCNVQVSGSIFIILDDSSTTTAGQFSDGKKFVSDFILTLTDLTSPTVKVSIDAIGHTHTSVFPIQNISDFRERIGVLSMTDYRGGVMNFSLLEKFVEKIMLQSVQGFIIVVSSGQSLDQSLVKKLKANLALSKLTLMTVGLGRDTNWDNLEHLASAGYHIFDNMDGSLAAKHIGNELKTVNCTR